MTATMLASLAAAVVMAFVVVIIAGLLCSGCAQRWSVQWRRTPLKFEQNGRVIGQLAVIGMAPFDEGRAVRLSASIPLPVWAFCFVKCAWLTLALTCALVPATSHIERILANFRTWAASNRESSSDARAQR